MSDKYGLNEQIMVENIILCCSVSVILYGRRIHSKYPAAPSILLALIRKKDPENKNEKRRAEEA